MAEVTSTTGWWEEYVSNPLSDVYDWIMTDSDHDGIVDWDLREVGQTIGETVGNVIDPITESVGDGLGNISSGLTFPLILAAGVAVLVLKK